LASRRENALFLPASRRTSAVGLFASAFVGRSRWCRRCPQPGDQREDFPAEPAPPAGSEIAFELVDPSGHTVRAADLRGRWILA
jgi:hypothetical protein